MVTPLVPEGGVRCWKEIIDQMHSLTHQQESTKTALTIAISQIGSGYVPTEDDLNQYIGLAEPLAKFLDQLKVRALGG